MPDEKDLPADLGAAHDGQTVASDCTSENSELTAAYRYELPEDAVAQSPAEPRHTARLLDTRNLTDWSVSDLPDLLAPDDVVVVNNTRVRAARLIGRKPTGGRVEILVLSHTDDGWECLVRPARRLRRSTTIDIAGTKATVVSDPVDGRAIVHFDADVDELAASVGEVPLPPYIRGTIAPDRYQTVYAERVGSAAAPTAGLHLTDGVLERLSTRSIDVATVDLEVGLGTFRPITVERIDQHGMHAERYTIPPRTAQLVNSGRRVVAVGTTVVRALEASARQGSVSPGMAVTSLFIRPGFQFRCVDVLMTNFHVPGSSLVVMIAAFMGSGWRTAYRVALERGYRFLSFGDAMLCERGQ